jgi:hypothetical protein
MRPEIIIVVEGFAVLCRIKNRQSMHRFLLLPITGPAWGAEAGG